MSIDVQEQSEERSSSDAQARKQARQHRALDAEPDVSSPEGGETAQDNSPDSGGP